MSGPSSIIRVSLVGDTDKLRAAFQSSQQDAKSWSDKVGAQGKALTRGLTLPLLAAAAGFVALAGRQEEAEAKLSSTFRSMNAAAWTTEAALKDTASALQGVTTFGDEAIIGLEDLLLTFGNVTNKVGEGNDVFDRATKVGLDMSAALGQDLKSSAVQVGKALNDPIEGVSALTRVGVQFTDAQKDQIKTMTEAGDVLGAQKIILGELEKQFGGTAEAIAKTDAGKMKQAMNDLGDAGEKLGAVLLPIIGSVANAVGGLAKTFGNLPAPAMKIVVGLGAIAAAVGPILIGVGKLPKLLGAAQKGFGLLTGSPVLAGLALVAGAVYLISQNTTGVTSDLEGLRDAFETSGGKAHDAAKSFLEAYKTNENAITTLGEASLTMDDLADAIGGTIEQYDDFQASLKAAYDAGKITKLEYEGLSGTTKELRDETDLLVAAARHIPGTMYDGGEATGIYAGYVQDAADASGDAADKTIEFWEAQKQLTDPVFNLITLMDDYNEAHAARIALEEEGTTTGKEHADAVAAEAQAYLDMHGGMQEVLDTEGSMETFFDVLTTGLGLSKDEAIKLYPELKKVAAQLGLIADKNVFRNVTYNDPLYGYLPRHHSGGTFRAPTPGGEGLAILKDQERVYTSDQDAARGGGGGGTAVYITVNSIDPHGAGKAVVEALQSWQRSNGPLPVKVRG